MELWAVGDLVVSTPFLRAASERFSVSLLAKPHASDLQKRLWPEVEVIPFVAPWTAFRRKYWLHTWPWPEMIRVLRTLRQRRFDVGLSVRWWDPRDRFLLALAGVRRRIRFGDTGNRPADGLAVKPPPGSHRYESWRALARALEIELPDRAAIPMPPARKGCILIHTGAGQRVRVWPMERYRNVIQRLRQLGHKVHVACDAGQRGWWLAMGESGVATPKSLTELQGLIDTAGVLIGNDSGPGHMAAISGVPTFTIFGSQLPGLFAPLHPESVWIAGQPCPYLPCSDYCRFPTPQCLWGNGEDAVWPRIQEFITRHGGLIERTGTSGETVSLPAARAGDTPSGEPLRVLHAHNGADIYGSGRSLLRLLRTMNLRRFQPLVVVPEEGLLKECFEALGVEVIVHPRLSIITRPAFRSWRIVPFLLNFPLSVWWLWRLIRRRRIQLVHTNSGVVPSPALAARLAGVSHVWHIRDWFQEFRSFWPVYAWYMKRFSRKVIAVSNAVADQYSPRDNVVVIHNGFSLEEFQLPAQARAGFRSRHGLEDRFVVGCVGRIKMVRKGQEVLARATALLKQRGLRIKALIVGAPFPGNEDHLTRLRELVDELGIAEETVFTGELSDTRPAYAAMDVLAMTSVQPEPFGGVVMEAMSMGVPVVATSVGGSLDQVVEGVTGLFVPPGDANALADAIERLMRDPGLCRRMGEAAVDRIRNEFSLAEMAGRIEALFEEAVARR